MKIIKIGLAAVLALVVMAPATATFAAKKPAAGAIDPKMLEKGMAEAPARLAATKLTCTLTAARWVGADPKAKADAVEVACSEGIGYLLETTTGTDGSLSVKAFPCLALSEPVNGAPNPSSCKLAPNSVELQMAALNPFIAKFGRACTIEKARVIGQTTNNMFFEVACQGGLGYVLITSAPPSVDQPLEFNTCLAYEPTNSLGCKLSDRDFQITVVDTLNTAAAKSCVIKDRRYVLATKTGSAYFEVSCEDGKGYMYEQAANGALQRSIDCANADFIPGGCTLTDARAAQSEQASLYTTLVKKAGYDCNVSTYSPLPVSAELRATVIEAVELKCDNRPDGAIVFFPKASGPTAIFNCAAAPGLGYSCRKSKAADALVQINRDIAAAPDKPFSCVAYTTGGLALTDADVLLEVGCDPEGRFAVAYSRTSGKPSGTRPCTSMGDKCTLPIRKP